MLLIPLFVLYPVPLVFYKHLHVLFTYATLSAGSVDLGLPIRPLSYQLIPLAIADGPLEGHLRVDLSLIGFCHLRALDITDPVRTTRLHCPYLDTLILQTHRTQIFDGY